MVIVFYTLLYLKINKILVIFNRALYGYEDQTNNLKLVSSGEGGVEELCEDLNSGKIMYAFVRIEDPKTGLKKFLLINWQVICMYTYTRIKYAKERYSN